MIFCAFNKKNTSRNNLCLIKNLSPDKAKRNGFVGEMRKPSENATLCVFK